MDVWSLDRNKADQRDEIKKVGVLEGVTKKLPVAIREVMGNLRFPLDKTYHGCLQNSSAYKTSREVIRRAKQYR
jgi:hypothetical protein